LPGFRLEGPIARNARCLLYRAIRVEDADLGHSAGRAARASAGSRPGDRLVRVAAAESPGRTEEARWESERQILRSLGVKGVARLAEEDRPGQRLLVLEAAPGEALSVIVARGGREESMGVSEFLAIALEMTAIVGGLHAAGVTHKDLQPANFLWDARTRRLTLTDAWLATRLPRERPALTNPEVIEGTLAYISPEQTGRMNRPLDYRTDFYSLGATFFELLTGTPPFDSTDSLELVHAHIARRPPRVDAINPAVPKVIGDIVAKLLEKNAEDRYQSAEGLGSDLDRCRTKLAQSDRIEHFRLGQNDASAALRIPAKLYGRHGEVATLLAAFEKAAAGTTEAVLVSGYSGVGKTALVHEIHKPVTIRRGHFIEGKFDSLHRNIPYSAWVVALTGLVHYLLMEGEAELEHWRTRLLASLGGNGQVVLDVIPDLRLVIGPQPAVPDVTPTEMQNRFRRVFGDLVRALATADHPLAVFLDDLQWADAASLALMETLPSDPELAYVLVVGAYRESEVDAGHPLWSLLDRWKKAGRHPTALRVRPLRIVDVERLLADTMLCSVDRAGDLARLVHSKTDGNPFFIAELLETLHSAGLIVHDKTWQWDLEAIRRAPIGDDIAELMAGKIVQLPTATLSALKVAACIGVEFDVDLVARVTGKPQADVAADLEPALRAGLIESSTELRQFVHDKVTEAAYGLTTAEERQQIHHAIGRALLAEAGGAWPDELVFRIAQQLNDAGPQLEPGEIPAAFEANRRAGGRAKASAAFATAAAFYRRAVDLLPPDAWETNYRSTLDLYTDWAEAAQASIDHETAAELFTVILTKATTLQDRMRIHLAQLEYYKASMRFQDALDVILRVLDETGVPFLPIAEIDEAATEAQLARFMANMADRSPADLARLPVAPTPYLEAIEVLASAGTLLWIAFPGAALYGVLLAANLSLEHGVCGATAETLTLLGSFLCGKGRVDLGTAMGEVALRLLDRFDEPSRRGPVSLIYFNWVAYWKNPLRQSQEPLLSAYHEAARIGDNLNAAYLINNHLGLRLWSGDPLPSLSAALDQHARPFFRLNQPNTFVTFNVLRQAIQGLLGNTSDPSALEGDFWSEARDLPELWRMKFSVAIAIVGFAKLLVYSVMGNFDRALEWVRRPGVEDCMQSAAGLYMEVVSTACTALAYLRGDTGATNEVRADNLAKAEAIAARLQTAAETYPPNFLSLYALVAAELARVKGDEWEAVRRYNQSIAAARGQDSTHLEALANELAALFWLDQDRDSYARPHLVAAYAAYKHWGARAKIDQMRVAYPWLATERSVDGESGPIDLIAVTRAGQVISSEIELDGLLARLLQIAIETAGAERGMLLLIRDGQLTVEAEATSEKRVAVLQSVAAVDRTDLPQSVLLYVSRSGESVLLDDATTEGDYVADPAIVTRKPRSVLCLPINRQGILIGIVYLENSLVSGAFGPNHLEVLQILCAQAAISLENARLYAERDRTLNTLRESEEKYRALVENTADVVFSMDTHGRFTYLSPGMERLSDYTVAEALGKSYAELVVPEDLERVDAAFERSLAGDITPLEFRGARKDGRVVHLRVSPKPIFEDDLVVGFTGILADISERRQLEEQLLQAMKMESIGRLAGGVAHDFNNLLTAILGNAELALLDLPPESDARDAVAEIAKAGQRASTLTRQLLAFASKQIVAPVRLNLSTAVADSERMLRRLLGEDIEITTNLDPHLGPIEADPGQMEQLLVNLTINARDAMPNGGRLTIETRNAVVGESGPAGPSEVAPGMYSVLTITDTGAGMSPDVLAHIFEPFYTTKDHGKGTGLGLATCHGIVKQNRGHIFVFSEPGLGATFRILLPLARPGAIAQTDEPTPPKSIDGDEAILVVEDEESVRRLAVLGLRAHGYDVTEAPDGAVALKMARRPDTRIDLVISDIVMPGISGLELGHELTRLRPGIRVMLVSGHAEKMILPDRQASGFAFVQKPFTPEQLARRVRETLDSPFADPAAAAVGGDDSN
jgi:PAS domain S-box-containing protein